MWSGARWPTRSRATCRPRLPLPALFSELLPAQARDAVVLSSPDSSSRPLYSMPNWPFATGRNSDRFPRSV